VLASGVVIDERHEIEQLLGHGGMAEVFRARDTRTGRTVAIKLLLWPPPPSAPVPADLPPWMRHTLQAMAARDPRRRPPATAVAQALWSCQGLALHCRRGLRPNRPDQARRAVDRCSQRRDHRLERDDREPNRSTSTNYQDRSRAARPRLRQRRRDDGRISRDPRPVPRHLAIGRQRRTSHRNTSSPHANIDERTEPDRITPRHADATPPPGEPVPTRAQRQPASRPQPPKRARQRGRPTARQGQERPPICPQPASRTRQRAQRGPDASGRAGHPKDA
jgi:hypothetical protein